MHNLPNGCQCSDIKITPNNWNGKGATTKKKWRIYYRFLDPAVGKLQLITLKLGLNELKDLQERRTAAKELIANEWRKLQKGYNPITRTMVTSMEIQYEIDPDTPFVKALEQARGKLSVGHRTSIGIKSVIKGVKKASEQLLLGDLTIAQVRRRHLKMILERCSQNSKRWSNGRFNLYRAYLLMLFKELVELEAVDSNPVRDISKKPVAKKLKVVLSDEQRKQIHDHLQVAFPRFLSFIHLFFHSGGRKTELLQLKPGNVDLVNLRYRCTVYKRKSPVEVVRTIKEIAVPYWKEFLDGCPDNHFLFGTLFKPGLRPIGLDMPTKYWRIHVKENLGIPVDFYALKHLNTTEIVDQLDPEAAAQLNAQTSTAMVRTIYDVRGQDRQHEKLKKANNKFA
jgi:integrase